MKLLSFDEILIRCREITDRAFNGAPVVFGAMVSQAVLRQLQLFRADGETAAADQLLEEANEWLELNERHCAAQPAMQPEIRRLNQIAAQVKQERSILH